MQSEFQFAGFGGQGIMMIGRMWAYAGMNDGMEVCWLPSYGPEMRGGTAYCTVVMADRPIGSPVISNPKYLVAMNRPSLEKFAPVVKSHGAVVINSSLIPITVERTDVEVLRVPCNDIAVELGDARAASMVALGALAACSGAVKMETLESVLREQFKGKQAIVETNLNALRRGAELGKSKRGAKAGR